MIRRQEKGTFNNPKKKILLFDFVSIEAVMPWPVAGQWHPKEGREGSSGGAGNGADSEMEW